MSIEKKANLQGISPQEDLKGKVEPFQEEILDGTRGHSCGNAQLANLIFCCVRLC